MFAEVTAQAFRDPDVGILNEIDCRGVIITTQATREQEGVDFVSRFFGPR